VSTSRPRRPLVLLPDAKGTAPGGDGPAYASVLAASDHPLAASRRRVLAALVAAADTLAPARIARLTGVGTTDAEVQRSVLRSLAAAPTLPAHRRFTGVVHGNAGLAGLDPAAAPVEVVLVSALAGLVGLEEPVPDHRLELTASVPPLGGLATTWRRAVAAYATELASDRTVWDLLPGEHARVWPVRSRGDADVVRVRFLRPDGRAANAARAKVAKGRLTAHLLAAPADAAAGPAALLGRDDLLGAGWKLALATGELHATWLGG
jgi:uncharacterized protein